jgi:microcystin-dependent protein
MANNPTLLQYPLVVDGDKNTIPATDDGTTGLFSQRYGWQSINSLPLDAGGKAVRREDYNGVFALLGNLLWYMQKGFTFNYDNTVQYYINCVVIDPDNGKRYRCKADTTGNGKPHTDSTHWELFAEAYSLPTATTNVLGGVKIGTNINIDVNGRLNVPNASSSIAGVMSASDKVKLDGLTGVPTGTVYAFAGQNAPTGYLFCDGSAVSRTTYANLFAVIGTTYGAGNGTTTFNLPNLIDRFVQGSATSGTYKSAGLPNFVGYIRSRSNTFYSDASWTNSQTLGHNATGGAFSTVEERLRSEGNADSNSTEFVAKLDPSTQKSIYGASDTVQPPALTMRYIIKT